MVASRLLCIRLIGIDQEFGYPGTVRSGFRRRRYSPSRRYYRHGIVLNSRATSTLRAQLIRMHPYSCAVLIDHSVSQRPSSFLSPSTHILTRLGPTTILRNPTTLNKKTVTAAQLQDDRCGSRSEFEALASRITSHISFLFVTIDCCFRCHSNSELDFSILY